MPWASSRIGALLLSHQWVDLNDGKTVCDSLCYAFQWHVDILSSVAGEDSLDLSSQLLTGTLALVGLSATKHLSTL